MASWTVVTSAPPKIRAVAKQWRRYRARMPSAAELDLLKIGAGVPIFQLRDVNHNEEDRPLQAAEDLYAGDRHEFAYEWTEGDIRS